MLIVNTDHGFLMGEHDWWAKVVTPFFQEIAHIPFWCYDPRYPNCKNVQSEQLAQTIDLGKQNFKFSFFFDFKYLTVILYFIFSIFL